MSSNFDAIDNDMQSGYDFDWFFVDNHNNVGMVASYMGKLPISVATSYADNTLLVSFFQSLPIISPKIIIIKNTRSQLIDTSLQTIGDSFTKMAQRGLFAFDKVLLNNLSDDLYKVVTRPTKLLSGNDLPIDVMNIVGRTRYDGDITTMNEFRTRDIS